MHRHRRIDGQKDTDNNFPTHRTAVGRRATSDNGQVLRSRRHGRPEHCATKSISNDAVAGPLRIEATATRARYGRKSIGISESVFGRQHDFHEGETIVDQFV